MTDQPLQLATALLESLGAGVVCLSPAGRIVYISPALPALLDLPQHELSGMTLEAFYQRTGIAPLTPLQRTGVYHRPHLLTVRYVPDAPALAPWGVASFMVFGEDLGNTMATLLSLQSHDVFGAIDILRGGIDLLQRTDLGLSAAEQRDLRISMHNAMRQITRSMHQYRSYYALLSNSWEVNLEDLALVPILESTCAQLAGQHTERTRTCTLTSALAGPMIWSDRQLCAMLVEQLLDNAFRSTSQGGTIAAAITAAGADHVRLEITTSGAAIPADLQRLLFQQPLPHIVDSTVEPRGAGIGLLLCRIIAQRVGAQLAYQYLPQLGNQFAITFPARRPDVLLAPAGAGSA